MSKEQQQSVLNKYKDMADIVNDFDCISSNRFLTPTMGEMIQEDLMTEILDQQLTVNGDETTILDAAYYNEEPFTTVPGYYPEEGVFILKAYRLNEDEYSWTLNKFDGDTTSFKLSELEDGNSAFTMTNNKTYNSFKDYYSKTIGGSSITIRNVGIDAPEIPHLEIQAVPKSSTNITVEEMTFGELKKLKTSSKENISSVVYLKYIIENKNNIETAIDRNDKDKVKVLKLKADNKVSYYEILQEINGDYLLKPFKDYQAIKLEDIDGYNKNYSYYVIVSQDDTEKNKVVDGYKAKRLVEKYLSGANVSNDNGGQALSEIILMLDARTISMGITTPISNMAFNNLYYVDDLIGYLVEEWNKSYEDIPQTNHKYNAFGTDAYGRCLGAIYVKQSNGGWMNLAKRVIAEVESSIIDPDFNEQPELQMMNSGLSDIFNLWSYRRDNFEWADSFDQLTRKSYQDKIDLHRELTGIDFIAERDCALFIGDTLMLLPPESIRNITQSYYERVPNMRSKGTMAKNKGQNEHMLEITLYFYEDAGINGIARKFTTPSGEEMLYYMNGLRSLIAQFKIAPFLPIENGYINDILGIEAVALQNLSIQTVEGIPRLLKAVLTLREFNYRTFMPDVPLDDPLDNTEDRLSIMQPMFAKCFNWELFRYYYQRSIIAGENLENIVFPSYAYNYEYYSHKNSIGRWDFCKEDGGLGSTISIYIPDENWLNQASQIYIEKQNNLYITPEAEVKLSNNAKLYLQDLSYLYANLSKIDPKNVASTESLYQPINNFWNKVGAMTSQDLGLNTFTLGFDKTTENTNIGATKKWLDVLNYSNVCVFSSKNAIDVANSEFCETYIQPIVNSFYDIIGSSNCVNGITIDETIKKENDYWTVVWTFKIGMDTTSLTTEEYQSIKEVLAKSTGTTLDKVFVDDQIRINFSMKFKSELLQYPKIIRGGNDISSSSQDTFCFEGGTDYNALSCASESSLDYEDSISAPDEGNNAFNYSIDYYVRDYKNPANMPYVAYLEGVVISKAFVSISNSFTNISLKAVEGIGSQYLGGQDTQLELELITSDNLIVAALNQLPTTASAMAKKYKRVIPAWPIKIKSELTDLLGVSEVVIDTMEVSTVQGYPGVYSIAIRLTSVDRTQRQQEALRKLDVTPTGGNVDNSNYSNLALKEYMNINETLSKAELYPDLDLPTIEDLAKKGWRFVKYSSVNRVYPDPDFYITYAYPYSSLLIKKMVKDSLAKQLLIDDTSTEDIDESQMLQKFTLKDTLGTEMTAKLAATFGLEILDETNSNTTGNKTYSSVMEDYKKAINEKIRQQYNLTESDIESLSNTLELANIMTYLTVSDVNDGWEIRPGWRAPLANINTNISIKDLDIKFNLYAEDIKKRRSQALKCIDDILKQPLKTKAKKDIKENLYLQYCIDAVNEFFYNDDKGRSLLELLCPTLEIKEASFKGTSIYDQYAVKNTVVKEFFEDPNPLNYLAGYLFASGCALSGQQEFSNSLDVSKWSPNHFAFNSGGDYEVYAQDDKDVLMPFVEVERAAGSNRLAKTLEQANKNGIRFGAWRIGKYSKATIEDMTNRYDNSITYSETDIDGKAHDDVSFNETYKDKTNKDKIAKRYINSGFIDPYYNYLEDNTDDKSKEELYNYKEAIAINIEANAEAFLRNMLVCMRRLILDGLLISELDIIVENHNSLTAMLTSNPTESDKLVGGNGAFSWAYSTLDHNNTNKEILEQFGFDIEEWEELLETIKLENKRSVCARLIYPFLTAITENSSDFYSLLLNRDYDSLENMIGYVDSNTFITSSRNIVLKFLYAISGIGLSSQNEGKNTIVTSASQKIMNSIIKDVYIKASEDPRMYLLHSFYDMLVNDKRGRLVRAFPTYYVVFVDEGRKIGSWKLHDNFYNMNSIAEIQVVKSRKIAADTCTLIMNNTFNSYTDTADSTTSQLYVDVYGLKDVFNSIFSPRAYFEKEKAIRLRQQVTDKVLLTPGIRIHVRVGYSADGSKLPIVFNGKVAEVGTEDVVQIVAQGDGHELMNPLSEFGDIEVTALDASQSTITWGKDIRGSLSKGGETPRDLLAKPLTATHGGWKKATNKLLDGRWFNDNPFGLVHFGDKKFNEIFDLGEPVQNLYEVSDASLLKGVNEISSTSTSKKATPIINTSLMDKTFWDLLHLAANTGLEYIGAVRDFGFRSTIFLGRPNYYYAYDYVLVDNKIVEKRKPFQQFHYYDSYNDIIYNGIKASESQMKTNAIGLWQSSKITWGREQATVGPIYLDMNIYPEYQKSMTVDTGLLAAGDGGIDLGILNHFSEKWNDINDNKVNESTAWRVTANALKNSVKDMYQGDMAVIGDPSVKPYDRCYIYDTYENMMGQFEVEAVIHTMSVSTGFTTSIMPDVIARHEDYYESSVQNILNTAGSFMGGTFACTIGDILLTRDSNKKLLKAIAKNKKMYGVTNALQKTVQTLSNKTGLQDLLNAEGNESYKQLFEEILPGMSNSNALELSRYDQLITDIAKIAGSDTDLSDIKNLSKALSNIIDLDGDTFDKAIKEALENDKWGNLVGREDEIANAISDAKKNLEKVKDSFNNINLDYKDIKEAIVNNAELYSIIGTKQKKILEQWANGVPEDLLSDFATLLEDSDILKAIDNGDIEIKNLDSLTDGLSDALKLFKNDDFIKAIRGGDIVEDVMKVILKVGTKFNVASIALSMVKATVGFVFTNNIKEMLYKTLQGIQAIDVYPLKKHGKPLTAGMAGHKGSVAMYPVADGYNSIQGMIMQVAEWITEPTGNKMLNDALMGIADFFLDIDEDKINTIFADWKSDLGIDTDVQALDETSADLSYNVFNDVASAFAASPEQYYYLISKPRKTSFDTQNKTDATYLYYEIKDVGLSNISTNEKVKDLYWLENDTDILTAMTNGKFKIVHNEAYDSTVNISFEDGTKVVPVMIDNSVIDTPLVQEEALYIIKRILRHDKMNKIYGNGVIHFKSGARLNDARTWKNTGFSFILEYQGLSDGTLDNILKEIKEDTTLTLNDGNQLMFTYQRSETVTTEGSNHGDKFVINVYPPIQSTDGMK